MADTTGFTPENANGHCWHRRHDPNGPGFYGFVCCHCGVVDVPKSVKLPIPDGHGPAYPVGSTGELYLPANDTLCRQLPNDDSRPEWNFFEAPPGHGDGEQCGDLSPHPPHAYGEFGKNKFSFCKGVIGETEQGFLHIRYRLGTPVYGYWHYGKEEKPVRNE